MEGKKKEREGKGRGENDKHSFSCLFKRKRKREPIFLQILPHNGEILSLPKLRELIPSNPFLSNPCLPFKFIIEGNCILSNPSLSCPFNSFYQTKCKWVWLEAVGHKSYNAMHRFLKLQTREGGKFRVGIFIWLLD